MKIPANVIDQLVTGAQSDIRQVLNMLSTWKLSSDAMDFDEGKDLYDLLLVHLTFNTLFAIFQCEDEPEAFHHESVRYYQQIVRAVRLLFNIKRDT